MTELNPPNSRSQSGNSQTWIWWIAALLCLFGLFALAGESDRDVAVNTFWLGLCAAAIAIPLGGLLAWAGLGKGLISQLLFLCCVGLLFVPMFSHVSAWDSAFGKLGWIPATRGQTVKPILTGWPAAIWVHAVAAAPQVAIIYVLGLAGGRRIFEEQALLDTSRANVFWRITLPRLLPLVILSFVWILISCAREIAVTDIFRIGTLAEQIYLGFSLGQFNSVKGTWSPEQIAAAQGIRPGICVAMIATVICPSIWFFNRLANQEFSSGHWLPTRQTGSVFKSLVAMLLLLLTVLIPFGNLFYRASFYVSSVDGKPTPGYSLDQLMESLQRVTTQYPTEFCWSFLIALTSTGCILAMSTLLGWKARTSRAWQFFFVGILAFCCAVPGPLFGVWISKLFSLTNHSTIVWLYDRTITAPVMTTTFFCLPVAGLLVWYTFKKTPQDILEGSQLEGVGTFSQIFRIGILANWKAFTGISLITFAYCFGELSTTQMVLPPGMDTVPRLTLGLLHAGVDEMTAALTIVTIAGITFISLVGWGLVSLNTPKDHQK